MNNLPTRYRLDDPGHPVAVIRRDREEEINIGTLTPLRRIAGSYLAVINATNGKELATFSHPAITVTQSSDGTIELDTGGRILPSEATMNQGGPIRYAFGESNWIAVD